MKKKNKKIICIIQARMSSKRLPGKMMMRLSGKSCIERVIQRVKKSNYLNEIWLATTKTKNDDVFIKVAKKENIKLFRGSVKNVLSRYAKIANISGAEIIIRITGDCPLIDHRLIDKSIRTFLKNRVDYLSNTIKRTYPDGLDIEVFNKSSIIEANKKAKHPFLLEHVTPYISGKYKNILESGNFSTDQFLSKNDFSNIRLTLDEKDDLKLLKKIFSLLDDFCSWKSVINLLKKEKLLQNINNHVKTNEESKRAINLILKKPILKKNTNRYKNSKLLFDKSRKFIPMATQTFSKSYLQWPYNVSPMFIKSGNGCTITDVDNNKYLDYLLALMPIILGYSYKEVDTKVKHQINSGVLLSLSHPIETELAETLSSIIPYAEMVKFGKTGSDALSGAIRLARAITQRDLIAVSGYHGWHDWFIGSTSRNMGVPSSIRKLTRTFKFNDEYSLKKILGKYPERYAAIVVEPEGVDVTKKEYLKFLRRICNKHGILLIFDEIVCGFRVSLGGASEKYGVIPDLGCFGKAMANGYPLSALVGKRKYMNKLEDVFVSGTFSGDTISLAASLATIKILKDKGVPEKLTRLGARLKKNLNIHIKKEGLNDYISFSGNDWWPRLNISNTKIKKEIFISLLRQELLKNGLFIGSSLNLCLEHCKESVFTNTLKLFKKTIGDFSSIINDKNPKSYLQGKTIDSVFKVR